MLKSQFLDCITNFSIDIHGPWHLGFWPSVMTHFNIIVSTFCVWF